MDQRSLYELQFAGRDDEAHGPNQWKNRDEYVVRYLQSELRGSVRAPRLLELSVGDGALSLALLARLEQVDLTCVDIASNRLENLRRQSERAGMPAGARLTVHECNLDTEFDSVPSERFHAVIALDVLEHVLDVFGFVENCRRVLEPGGLLLLRVPNIAYLKRRFDLLLGRLPVTASWFGTPGRLTAWRQQHGWDGGHLHLFTIPLVRALLEDCGLRPIRWGDPGARWAALRDLWPRLCYGNILVAARK